MFVIRITKLQSRPQRRAVYFLFEINRFAKDSDISIDGWIEETISGTKNYDKRKLGELLSKVKDGDLIICAELSRLGRSLFNGN